MVGGDGGANGKQTLFAVDAELHDARLGGHFSLCKRFALRLVDVLRLALTRAESDGKIAITLFAALADDLTIC